MIVVHGIPNCDSVRTARRWLKERGIAHEVRDLRADPPGSEEVRSWADAVDWERLLNRRGATWRTLPPAEREGVDEAGAVTLMVSHPLLIKRPVIDWGDDLTVGMDEEGWTARL